jgi:putative tricarboxylic transport membrane protein
MLGLGMRVVGFDAAPVALGLILGPIAEQGLVQGLLMGASLDRAWTVFFTRPFSIGIMVLAALSVAAPILGKHKLHDIRDDAVREQE